jgi:UDP-glucuronate 4-epimerase
MSESVILVTGVAGFIGSHVAEVLLNRGERVLGIDELNDYYSVANKKNNLKILSTNSKFSFVRADIRSLEQIENAVRPYSVKKIAHIAARAGVRPSIKDPILYEEVNVKGTLNLLEIAKSHAVDNFILTSSSSVYGNSKAVPFKEDDSATDKPISPYAATKKSCEALGYTYSHLYKIPISVIRPLRSMVLEDVQIWPLGYFLKQPCRARKFLSLVMAQQEEIILSLGTSLKVS